MTKIGSFALASQVIAVGVIIAGVATCVPQASAQVPAPIDTPTITSTPTVTPTVTITPTPTAQAVAFVDGGGTIYHSQPQPDGLGGYQPAATVYPLQPAPAATLIADFSSGRVALNLSNAAGPDVNGQYSATIATATPTATAIPATPTPTQTSVPSPALVVGAGAGTGATVGFIAGVGSNSTRGGITWTTGTSPGIGVQFTATLGQTYPFPPYVVCAPLNSATARLTLSTLPSTTTAVVSAATAPAANTTYQCEYIVFAGSA